MARKLPEVVAIAPIETGMVALPVIRHVDTGAFLVEIRKDNAEYSKRKRDFGPSEEFDEAVFNNPLLVARCLQEKYDKLEMRVRIFSAVTGSDHGMAAYPRKDGKGSNPRQTLRAFFYAESDHRKSLPEGLKWATLLEIQDYQEQGILRRRCLLGNAEWRVAFDEMTDYNKTAQLMAFVDKPYISETLPKGSGLIKRGMALWKSEHAWVYPGLATESGIVSAPVKVHRIRE